MNKRTLRSGVGWYLAVSCLLVLGGCEKKATQQVRERIANVRVQPAEIKALRPFVSAVGNLKASEEVVASAEVDGIIRNVNVDDGKAVAKGDLLAALNDTDYRLELQRSEVALKQSEATCANTTLEFERKESLYKEELVTRQQFDDVKTRLALSVAECDRARAGINLAKEKLAKTKVYSPLKGIIKEKKVSTGDYVRTAAPLFSIINIDTLKLNFTITEKDVGQVKVGQEVRFEVDAAPGREYNGRVSILYPNLEEKTRTLLVEALVPNPDHSLKPGLFARVTVYLGQPRPTIIIPVNAILYDEDKAKVFIVEDNQAKERVIKSGTKYGDMMEIVQGLKEKDSVVIVGQNNLAEGVKVNVAR